jgi:hypothetical protein
MGNSFTDPTNRFHRETLPGLADIQPAPLLDATTDPDRAAAKRAFEAMMKMKKIDIATIEAARRGTARA